MPTKQDIIISIGPDGNISYEVKGVPGKSCVELTEFLDELGDITERVHTGEYYQSAHEVDVVEEHVHRSSTEYFEDDEG